MAYWDFNTGKLVDSNSQSQSIYTPPKKKKKPEDGLSPLVSALMESRRARAELAPPPLQAPPPVVQPPEPTPMQYQPPASLGGGGLTRTLDSAQPAVPPVSGGKYAAEPPKIPWENGANDPLVSGVQRDPSQPGIIGGLVNALKGMADPSNFPEGVPGWQEYEKNTPWGQVKDKTTFGQSWVAGQGQALQIAGAGLDYLGADEIGKRWKEAGRLEIEGSGAPDPKQWEGMKSLLDPEYLATTATRQIPTALGALLMGAPLAAGGAAAAGAAGLGTVGTTLATGAAAGIPMTVFEAASEAGMAYDDVIAKGGSEEEAGAVGAEIFRKNVAVIGGPNIIEQALIFAPLPQPVKGALKGLGRAAKPMAAAGRVMGTAAMEGGQEGAQEYISMEAQGEPIERNRIIESIALGGLMGGGMAMPSAVGDMLGREAQGPKAPTPSGGENVLADVLAGRPVATPKPEQATEPAPVIETQDTSKQEMATENASKYTPENLSQIEPTALSAFPDMLETDEGGYSINNFSQNEQDSLRKAGVVITGEDGAERVDAEALWRARENFQKLSREEQKRLYKESNDRMFGATPESSAPSANEAPAPVVAEEKASIEEAAEAPTIPMFGYTNPIVIAIKDEYGMGTVTAIRKAQDNGEKITMEEAIKRGKEEDAASQQRREEYARIAAEQDKAEKEKLQGAKQEPKPQGKYGQIIEGEDGKKKFQVTGKGEESEAVIPEAEVQVEPTSEIAGAVRNVEAEGKAVEDYVKFTIGRREKNNGDRPYTESQRESETESFKELGNKLVDAIANKDVKYLRGWMNGINPGLNRLFTAVTGLPAKTQKEADASIRSLDPEGYDAWQNDKVQKREQAERERKQKEVEEKAAKKEAETAKIANSKIKIDGVTDTVENTVRRLYSEGFRVEKTNEYGGIKWVNAAAGKEVPLKKMPKELRKYLRALDRRLRDETTAEEYAKEQEEYDALSDEDKAEIDRFLSGESLTQEKTEAAEISDDKIDELVKRVVDEVKTKLDQPQPQEPGPKGEETHEATKEEAPKEEAKPTEYPVWKLDVIINDLPKIPADRIKDNPELTRKLYSDKKFTANEVIKLASLYDTEFEKNKIYVTGGYNEGAIKERFEYGREALKRTIWETYVEWREASIQVAMHEKRKAEERKSEPKSESAPEFEITKTKHTKTGEDLWVVKPTKRLSDSEFRQLTVRLKKLGGGWSRFTKGFNFKSDPTAALQPGEAATAPGAKVEPTPAPAEQSPEKPKFAPGEVVIAQDGKSKYLVHSYDPATNRLVGINPIGGTNTLASNSMTKTGEIFTEKEWKDSNFKEAEKLIAHINRGDRVEWVSGGNKLSGAVIRKTELMGQPALEVDTDQAAAPGGVPIRRIEFVTARNSTLKKIEESATEPQEDVAKPPQTGVKSNQGNNNIVEETKPTSQGVRKINPPEAKAEGDPELEMFQQSRDFIRQLEAEARARLEARKNRLLSGLPMDDLVDYSIIGMAKLLDKSMDLAEFTVVMLEEFGDSIKLFMVPIHAYSQSMLKMKPSELSEVINLASKEEGGPQDGKTSEEVLDEANEGRTGTSEGTGSDRTNVDSVPSPGGRGSGLPGKNDGQTPGDISPQQTEGSDTDAAGDMGSSTEGVDEGRGPEGAQDGANDSGEGQPSRNGKGSRKDSARDAEGTEDTKKVASSNFRIDNEENKVFTKGGEKARYKANIDALKTLDKLLDEGRTPTVEEQRILALYSGWGALPGVFDFRTEGNYYNSRKVPANEKWANEFKETLELLTEIERKHFQRDYQSIHGGIWGQARKSTMNAHYTSPDVIAAIYGAIQQFGYKKGNLLEPSMGTGNFFGMIPSGLAQKSKLFGVELDPLTGRIAQMLYPNSDVRIQGFQDAAYPDNFFDVAVGNVPFGDYPVNDSSYPAYLTERIHNYFFAKSLKKVKPGGILALITSTGTLDAKGSKVREYLSTQANFLGAIRLPGDAFKYNAGTEVTTDIIFLQKLKEGEITDNVEWVNTVDHTIGDQEFALNAYFAAHPDMVLGELVEDKLFQGRLGAKSTREDALRAIFEAIEKNLPADIFNASSTTEVSIEAMEAARNMLEGGITLKDGKLYRKVGDKVVEIKKNVEQIKQLVQIRDLAKEVLEMQRTEGVSEKELEIKRKRMKALYDSYVKKNGNLLTREVRNKKLYGRSHVDRILGYHREIKGGRGKAKVVITVEPEAFLLRSLEIEEVSINDEGIQVQSIKPSKILTARSYTPAKATDKVTSAEDGLVASINWYGGVDIDYISKIYGKSEEEIVKELGDKVYYNPTGGLETADEYLSGNVKKKLREATDRAEYEPEFQRNVDALTKIIPADIPFTDIAVSLGDGWIPAEITEKVVLKILGLRDEKKINLEYSAFDNTWNLSRGRGFGYTPEMTAIQAGINKDILGIIKIALNNSDTVIKVKDLDGREVVDQGATNQLKAKVRELRGQMADHLFSNAEDAATVQLAYNEKFNNTVPRDYEKAAAIFEFPNINPEVSLRPHQKTAIVRALLGGNSLLAHGVGAGKTYELIAIAMESKRLGLSTKPVLVVPNTKLTDFENDAKELYPGAKILALNEDDFNGDNIKQTLALAAANDWDMVVIRHSSFSKIPISPATEIPALLEELRELEEALVNMSGEARFTVKKIEKQVEKLRVKLARYQEHRARYEGMLNFEDLGFDMLLTDEAHEFKNYPLGGKAAAIKGLQSSDADKCRDMMIKSGYIRKLNGGKRGVIFATGTPISNSMAEIYVMFRYLRPDLMLEAGIHNFDAWADSFTEITEVAEISARGGFKSQFKFKTFINLPELITMFREFTDIKMQDTLDLPLPEFERVRVECEPSPLLAEVMQEVDDNWDQAVRDRTVLRLFNMVRSAPQDIRLVVAGASDHAGSKTDRVIKNAKEIYKKTTKDKGTQLIFLHKGESTITGFSMWEDIKTRLINGGIPESEIAFIRGSMSTDELEEIYAKINAGKIRVAIGSYGKMGVGINVQKRLFAIHEIDVPYRPADLEQAEGRMVRQGNDYYDKGETVQIYRYVTIGADKAFSGDAHSWQLIEGKVKGINSVMKGDPSIRKMEAFDADAYDAATLKASAIGDERWFRKIDLEREIDVLMAAYRSYQVTKSNSQREMKWDQSKLEENQRFIRGLDSATKRIAEDLERRATKREKQRERLGEERAYQEDQLKRLEERLESAGEDRASREYIETRIADIKQKLEVSIESQLEPVLPEKYLEINKKVFNYARKEERAEAEVAIREAIAKFEKTPRKDVRGETLAKINGFYLEYSQKYDADRNEVVQELAIGDGYREFTSSRRYTKLKKGYELLSADDGSIVGNAMKNVNALPKDKADRIEDNEKLIERIEKYQEIIKQPFKQKDELDAARAELMEIDLGLGLDVVAVSDPDDSTQDEEGDSDADIGEEGDTQEGKGKTRSKGPSAAGETKRLKEGLVPYTPPARAPHESRMVTGRVIEASGYEGTGNWILQKGVADDKLVKRLEKEEVTQKVPDESIKKLIDEAKQGAKYPLIPIARELKQGKNKVERVYLAKSNEPGELLRGINADYYDYFTNKMGLTIKGQEGVNTALGLFQGEEMVGIVMPTRIVEGERDTVGGLAAPDGIPSDLDAALEDLAEAVNDAIEEETLPMGQSIKLQFNPFTRPGGRAGNRPANQPQAQQFHLEDDEIEGRMRGAKGINKETTLSKFKEWIDEFKRKLARGNWEHLSRAKGEAGYYAVLRNALDRLKNQKGVAADKTLRALQGITVDLNPYEYDLFTFKVILDDLKQEADAEHLLPFGFTPESVRSELARIDREIRSYPNVEEALNKRNNLWDALRNARVQAAKAVGVNLENRFTKEDYYRHQVIEYANAKGLYGAGKRLRTPVNRGYMRKRAGSSYDINTDYLQAEFEVMSQMFYDIELDRVIKVVKDDYNIVDSLKAQARTANAERAEGEEKITWQSLIPEGYVEWQPREGSSWYKADSIPAALADQLYADQLEELGIKKEDLRQVFARGQKYGSLVVKEEVAATLNELQKESADVFILNMAHKLTNLWKINVLVGPRRIIKYNLRNLTGDADAVAVGNPKAFGKVAQASGELYQVFKGDRAMTPTMRKWFERGGMQTLLQVQELGEVNSLRMFAQLEKSKGTVKEIPVKLWQKYWKTARISTDFREAILRYANYLEYLEQMGNNPEGKPDNFGASIREEVMALKTIEDRAFKLSNDLLGAYDEISIVGQSLRKYLIPFWSWNEVNFVRYKRLFQNAIYDEKIATFVGKKLVGHLTRSPLLLMRVGKFALKANMMLIILQLWNMLMFPDEEKELPKSVTGRAHIILGRDEDGNIIHFTRLGAFQDLLDWFALDTTPQHVTDLLNGNKTIKEIAIEMVKSPFNKLAQGVNPLFKMPAELLLRSEFFPDVFEPRYGSVRDRGLYIAKTLGLENEYKEIAGLPSRGYARSIKELAVYLADPEEAAYNRAKEQKYTFLKEASNGGSEGFYYSAKSNALYNYKLAIRYKDKEAAAKYLEEYKLLGGTKEGLDKSIQSLHPLSGLSEKQKEAFKKSLSAEEKETIDRGIAYYKKVVGN